MPENLDWEHDDIEEFNSYLAANEKRPSTTPIFPEEKIISKFNRVTNRGLRNIPPEENIMDKWKK